MSREDSYLTILEATASIQRNICVILQAKAMEAEKSKRWICYHLFDSCYSDKEEQLKQSIEIHEKIVEMIDALTKLENGLAKNLKIVLNREEEDDQPGFGLGGGGGTGFGDLLGGQN